MNALYLFGAVLLASIVYWNLPRDWRRYFLCGLSVACVAAVHLTYALYFCLNIVIAH
jgi:hypothetical protein